MDIPPGIPYLFQRLPALVVPPTFVWFVSGLAETHLGIQISKWATVLASLLSLPLALMFSVLLNDYVNEWNAKKLGAVMPPQAWDRWPGGLSWLVIAIQNFKNGYPGELFTDCIEKYGHTFNMRILFENRIITTEPEHIKAILATQFDVFEKGMPLFIQFKTLLGTGVFNSDGTMWKFHRSMARPFFSKERISHFNIFDRHADDAIRQLKARLDEGYPVDVQDMVSRFTLDSATEFLFGNDVCSLSAGFPYPYSSPQARATAASCEAHPANTFAQAFAQAQMISALRSRWGSNWPIAEFWTDKAKKHMRLVNKFIDPILEAAVAKNKLKRVEEVVMARGNIKVREVDDGETLLDHLVNYTEDQNILRDEIMNILIAGRDTTATTLTFSIYMLAEHPNILRRLRDEILSKVGGHNLPTYDDMRDMKYLRAFINETLRLYPPVPFNIRISKKATTWPSKTPGGKPFYIPANTKTPYGVFLMHRRKDLWGPDAERFDPNRFLDGRQKYLKQDPFIFLPFNAGPRICLGQQFAYHEISFFLVRLLQNFSGISLAPDAQPPSSRPPQSWAQAVGYKAEEKVWLKTHLTLYAQEGVWVRMKEASPTESV